MKYIDVSKWQGTIDFNAVAHGGYAGVITRAIDSEQQIDPTLLRNLKEARDTGRLWTGAYHNLVNASVAMQFARFRDSVPDWKGVVPMVDSEQGASFKQLGAFQELAHLEWGVYPLVYLPKWYWNTLSDRKPLPPEWMWVHSDFPPHGDPLIPPYTSTSHPNVVWQYTNKGAVPGISTNVDLNLYEGREEDFLQLAVQ